MTRRSLFALVLVPFISKLIPPKPTAAQIFADAVANFIVVLDREPQFATGYLTPEQARKLLKL